MGERDLPRYSLPSRIYEVDHESESESDASDIASKRRHVYCTKCEISLHNPIYQIFEHPLLPVALCIVCFDELDKSSPVGFIGDEEDLTELCSWCGGDGLLHLCDNDDCGRAICATCIRDHLGEEELQEVEASESWRCYCCNPQPLEYLSKSMRAAMEASFFNEDVIQTDVRAALLAQEASDAQEGIADGEGVEEEKGEASLQQTVAEEKSEAQLRDEAKIRVLVGLTSKMLKWCAECSGRLQPESLQDVERLISEEKHRSLTDKYTRYFDAFAIDEVYEAFITHCVTSSFIGDLRHGCRTSVFQSVQEEMELYVHNWRRSWDIVEEQRADLETRLNCLGVQMSAEWHARELGCPLREEDESRFEKVMRAECDETFDRRRDELVAAKQARQAALLRGDVTTQQLNLSFVEEVVEVDESNQLPLLEEEAAKDPMVTQFVDEKEYEALSALTYPPSFEAIVPKSVIKAFFYAEYVASIVCLTVSPLTVSNFNFNHSLDMMLHPCCAVMS